jgi:ankyrin repeat protein
LCLAFEPRVDVIELLLEHGADPNIETDRGRLALDEALDRFRGNKNDEVVRLLKAHGAKESKNAVPPTPKLVRAITIGPASPAGSEFEDEDSNGMLPCIQGGRGPLPAAVQTTNRD